MVKKQIVSSLMLLVISVIGLSQNARQTILFNNNWVFSNQEDLVQNHGSFPVAPNFAFDKWQPVNLPHCAKIEPLVIIKPWEGISWYKKDFIPDPRWKSKRILLTFDAVMQTAEVWLNGKKIAMHEGGYLPFTIDISNTLQYGKNNRIIVKADNHDNSNTPPGKPIKDLDFCYYSGIYRNVSLSIISPLYISDAISENLKASGGIRVWFPTVSAHSATIAIATHIRNSSGKKSSFMVTYILTDKTGKQVSAKSEKQGLESGATREVQQVIDLKNPLLWHPDHPNLYTLEIKVSTANKEMDNQQIQIGIRKFEINQNHFLINGEPLLLVGTNRHQEYPYIGNALPDNAQYRDALKIKEAGFNIVRLSHYPQSPAFMDACDKLGILTMDAIPGWQFVGTDTFKIRSYQTARELIRRDRNHACVAMWELSLNESPMPDNFMQQMVLIAKEESPESKLITCGWINKYYDVFIPARQHARFPDYWKTYQGSIPLFTGEYGDWEYFAQDAGLNQAGYAGLKNDERTSRQFRGDGEKRMLQQALNFQEAHNDNRRNPHLGDANWVMFDYNRGYSPDIESSGIMDIFRLPKFAYYFYKSQVKPDSTVAHSPMVKIASFWNQNSDVHHVKVYANCDEVALYLNNKLIERKKPVADDKSDHLLFPPYSFDCKAFEAGELKAVGYSGNRVVSQDIVNTAKEAASLRLTVDTCAKPLSANQNDVIFVYATVTDSNGYPVEDATSVIKFTITGNAKLIGQNPMAAEAGIATILLQAGDTHGPITIQATTEGLMEAKTIIHVLK